MPHTRFTNPAEFGQPGDELTGQYRAGHNPLCLPAATLLLLAIAELYLLLPTYFISFAMQDLGEPETPDLFGVMLGSTLFILFAKLTIMIGAVSMFFFRHYYFAIVAAVLAAIPVISMTYLLGIPLGMYTISLLSRDEVRRRFR